MQVIFDFFSTLGDAIVALINFVVKMVSDMVYMIGVFGELLPSVPAFFTWLPPYVVSLLSMTIGCVIVYRIMGWSS